jgi:hypothetical protein
LFLIKGAVRDDAMLKADFAGTNIAACLEKQIK